MSSEATITDQVRDIIGQNPVVLFIKGTPDQPRCGFSMRVVQIMEQMGVDYGAVDVLPALEPLREATGEIADWRTFPQLYVKGSLVGGCDIVEEMFSSGELAEALGVEQPDSAPDEPEGAGGGEGPGGQQGPPTQSPPMQLG